MQTLEWTAPEFAVSSVSRDTEPVVENQLNSSMEIPRTLETIPEEDSIDSSRDGSDSFFSHEDPELAALLKQVQATTDFAEPVVEMPS